MTLSQVVIRHDVATVFGTITRGSLRYAEPSGDGRWLVTMWFPHSHRKGRAVLVKRSAVFFGREETVTRAADAHRDYGHARTTLGYSHESAVLWIAEGYRVSLKTLRQWGFATGALEKRELLERRARREAVV